MHLSIRLKTKRLVLRVLQPSDISEEYIQGLNDPEVNRYLFDVRFAKQTRETVLKFVEANLESPTDLLFGIFLNGEKFVGTIRISKISKIHFSCSLGICIFNKGFWNQGVGTEGIQEVVRYLFQELGLHYVEAGAYLPNRASVVMFEKVGFKFQAEFKNKYRYEDDFMPVVFLGIGNPHFDFRKLKTP